MVKYSLIIIIIFSCLSANAQKLKEYTASNGKTYHLGDTVIMGKGTLTDGRFASLGMTGKAALAIFDKKTNGDNLWASRYFENGKGIIKKISTEIFAGNTKPYFILDFHQGADYMLFIEDAINSKEVK